MVLWAKNQGYRSVSFFGPGEQCGAGYFEYERLKGYVAALFAVNPDDQRKGFLLVLVDLT